MKFRREEFSTAHELFENLAQEDAFTAIHLFFFGMCQIKIGDTGKGRETLKLALGRGLEEPYSTEAAEALISTAFKSR